MQAEKVNYGAYGERDRSTTRAAYAGEVIEDDTGWYLLGDRIYHPALRRFLGPDIRSPFDDGGLNRYAYCGGDPVNRNDPSGESFLKWFGMVLGVVGAVLATVATAGIAAAGVAAGVTPMLVATVASSAMSITAEVGSVVAVAAGKYQLSMILGFVGLAAGALGMPGAIKAGAKVGALGRRAASASKNGLAKLGRRSALSAKPGVKPMIGDSLHQAPGRSTDTMRPASKLQPARHDSRTMSEPAALSEHVPVTRKRSRTTPLQENPKGDEFERLKNYEAGYETLMSIGFGMTQSTKAAPASNVSLPPQAINSSPEDVVHHLDPHYLDLLSVDPSVAYGLV